MSRYLLITLKENLAAEGTTHNTAVIAHRLVPGTETVDDVGEQTWSTIRAICRPEDAELERYLRSKPRKERHAPRDRAQV